jgi:hypothetical protein
MHYGVGWTGPAGCYESNIALAQSSGFHVWSVGRWGPVAGWARGRWLSIFALYCCMAAIISACRMSSMGSAISAGGWEFVAETQVERLFGLQGGYAVTADTRKRLVCRPRFAQDAERYFSAGWGTVIATEMFLPSLIPTTLAMVNAANGSPGAAVILADTVSALQKSPTTGIWVTTSCLAWGDIEI